MSSDKVDKVPEVKYPRHILVVGAPDASSLKLLQELTGSAPTPRTIPVPGGASASSSLALAVENDKESSETPDTTRQVTSAGLSHVLELRTRYYKADVPIWIDETNDPTGWKTDFLTAEASEVVKAVGAWIVVFRKTEAGWKWARDMMAGVRDSVSQVFGGEGIWDGTSLCVGMPTDKDAVKPEESGLGTGYEDWEDECFDLGFELVDGEIDGEAGKTRSAAGELRGVARLREALETNEWDNVDDLNDSLLGLDEDEPGSAGETSGFQIERAQLEGEFAGLKMAMTSGDDAQGADEESEEQQVEELERMMSKMHAVRDMSAHMSDQDRRRLANRTVAEMMKEMP